MLREKSSRGFIWTGSSQVLNQALRLGITLLLAALVGPEELGLAGMALLFVEFVKMISEFGMTPAIVQKHSITGRHLSTGFWFNVATGIALTVLGVIAAPAIAAFFDSTDLTSMVRWLSLAILFSAPGMLFEALLTRDVLFEKIAIAEILSLIAYGAFAVTLAILGHGAWSIVWATIVRVAVRTSFMLFAVSWRPEFSFGLQELKELAGFGLGAMGARILNSTASNLDYLIVGRFLGAEALGYYTVAYTLGTQLIQRQFAFTTRVAFPVYARLQHDDVKIRMLHRRYLLIIAAIAFPLSGFVIIFAPQLVRLFLDVEWSVVISPLRLLLVAGALQALGPPCGVLYLAKGRSDLQFIVTCIRVVLWLAALLVGIQFGLVGVSASVLVASVFILLITQSFSLRLIGLRIDFIMESLLQGTSFALTVLFLPSMVLLLANRLQLNNAITLTAGASVALVSTVILVKTHVFPRIVKTISEVTSFLELGFSAKLKPLIVAARWMSS